MVTDGTAERVHLVVDAVGEVAAWLPGLELVVLGDGPGRASLEERAIGSPARVVFPGAVPGSVRADLLASAWLWVSADASGDPTPGVLAANAAGVPVVVASTGAARDAVRHGRTGWLVDPDAAEDLVAVIAEALHLLSVGEAAAAVAAAARAWAAQFPWSHTAEQLRLALAVERGRLGWHRHDRRTANDVASLVRLRRELLPEGWEDGRRRGDAWTVRDGLVRGLLVGADETDALAALRRLGVDPDTPAVDVVVARPADLFDVTGLTAGPPGAPLVVPVPAGATGAAGSGDSDRYVVNW